MSKVSKLSKVNNIKILVRFNETAKATSSSYRIANSQRAKTKRGRANEWNNNEMKRTKYQCTRRSVVNELESTNERAGETNMPFMPCSQPTTSPELVGLVTVIGQMTRYAQDNCLRRDYASSCLLGACAIFLVIWKVRKEMENTEQTHQTSTKDANYAPENTE